MRSKTKLGLNLFLVLALVAAILVSNINFVKAEEEVVVANEGTGAENQAGEEGGGSGGQDTPADEEPKEVDPDPQETPDGSSNADEKENEVLGASEEFMSPALASPLTVEENKFYFEITPEILIKEALKEEDDKLFASGLEAFGKKRVIKTYKEAIKSDAVREAWESVKFKVFDKEGKEIDSNKFQVFNGDSGRLKGAKYIGPFDKNAKYTIKVDTEKLPKDYHAWFTAESAYDKNSDPTSDLLTVGDEPKEAKDSDKAKNPPKPGFEAVYDNQKFNNSKHSYAEVRFHMDITHVVFARSRKIAEGLFKFDGKGKFTGVNSDYEEGKDYVLATVGKDNLLPEGPKDEALKKITPEGRKAQAQSILYMKQSQKRENDLGFYDYGTIKNNDYFGLLNQLVKEWINKPENFEQTGSFLTFVNAQAAKVTFNWNYSGAGKPVVQRVYFNKSLKTNTVSEDDQKYPKTFPDLPKDINMAFVSWNTKPDGTGQEFTLDTVVTDDITVYAQWSDTIKITFDPNGGSGKMDDILFKLSDNPFVLPKCAFKAPEGKVFAGWEIDGKTYKEGAKVKLTKDTVIKALWKDEKILPKTSTVR